MLDFYTKLGEVHTEDYREIMNLLYLFEVMPPEQQEEFKLTSLEVAGLRNTLKDSALEVFHIFLGITDWEINKDNYEKARTKYKEKNMGNAYLAIIYELFKDMEEKDWLEVTQGDIEEAKNKVLILFMKDFFKTGNFETKEDEHAFIDQLKAVESKSSKREAKRIQALLSLFEKYRKDAESNE
jgi:hypothetical protein